ncbi:MAG TPA: 3-methyl-2-oxobutanoate hydroxymethyltransferase [Thermomicrobiaceae bacterium]|nr:3-methyl-2-oxobutanoate hydroxymethyltransferase [Thermomicrobiaceae bacterium]
MRVSIQDLKKMKRRGERIAMLTCYDYPTARMFDEAGIPLLLVGDSLGNVILGYETTIPVTLEDIIHHCRAVIRGTTRALVVADLPFLTYQISENQALGNAARLIQEGGAQAVKLEGGAELAATVERIVGAGIPVMGHLGLTPQSFNQMGGFHVQARTTRTIQRIVNDALALEAAGAFSVVLECIPAPVAKLISQSLSIPTIGIGAGPDCDGQVQVIGDLLHLGDGELPRHARPYAEIGALVRNAAIRYAADVTEGAFPGEAESFALPKQVDLADIEIDAAGARVPKRSAID